MHQHSPLSAPSTGSRCPAEDWASLFLRVERRISIENKNLKDDRVKASIVCPKKVVLHSASLCVCWQRVHRLLAVSTLSRTSSRLPPFYSVAGTRDRFSIFTLRHITGPLCPNPPFQSNSRPVPHWTNGDVFHHSLFRIGRTPSLLTGSQGPSLNLRSLLLPVLLIFTLWEQACDEPR